MLSAMVLLLWNISLLCRYLSSQVAGDTRRVLQQVTVSQDQVIKGHILP